MPDINAEDLQNTTRFESVLIPMGDYCEVRILIDNVIVSTGVGLTVGEAVMVAGRVLQGIPITSFKKEDIRISKGQLLYETFRQYGRGYVAHWKDLNTPMDRQVAIMMGKVEDEFRLRLKLEDK